MSGEFLFIQLPKIKHAPPPFSAHFTILKSINKKNSKVLAQDKLATFNQRPIYFIFKNKNEPTEI